VPAGSFEGALFDQWIVGGTDVAGGGVPFTLQRLGIVESARFKPTLTFIFREGLELTAKFVANPFTAQAGTYNGLIRPSLLQPVRLPPLANGTARTNATEGRFSATVGTTGAFSGTLTIDGQSLAVTGAFDNAGDARFGTARLLTQTVAIPNKPSLVVALHLAGNKITGTVSANDFKQSVTTAVSIVDSDRAYYNGTSQIVPSAYLVMPGNVTATYSVIFPAKDEADQADGHTTRDYPQGHGTGTLTVTKAGVVVLSGTLAEGTPVSGSSSLSQTNTFPLFVQLYNKLGFLSGMVALNSADPDSDMAAADLQWLRPFQNTHYYPHGWPVPIKVDMFGAKYQVTANQSVLKAPGGGSLAGSDGDGNVTLSFSEGQLDATLDRYVSLPATDVVAKVPSNDATFTLGITRATGVFTGTFEHTDDTRPSFNGIIYQKGVRAGGYGYFLTKQPVPIDYTGESGGVQLIGQP
jgi:hypothetical protein